MTPRPLGILATAVLVLATLDATLPSATADTPARSAETITLRPATLERGENPAVPQLLGRTILDGDTAVTIRAREVQLLGKSGDDYVVGSWRRNGDTRVERVSADGDRETLMDSIRGDLVLSRDGEQVLETVVRSESRTVITVRDARTGGRLARRAFPGVVTVLDADEDRAILGASSPDRTLWWNTRTDGTKKISGRIGYFADIRADRIATLTADPYSGGCSDLAALSAPRKSLWRSCKAAVMAAAPDGRRLVTVPLLLDGPLSKVSVHGDRGRLFASYRSSGTFGSVTWEGDRSLLLVTYGTKKSAIVRCEPDGCERASKRIDTP